MKVIINAEFNLHDSNSCAHLRCALFNELHYEFFEERAAIREYDGGQSRKEAEKGATIDTIKHFNLGVIHD